MITCAGPKKVAGEASLKMGKLKAEIEELQGSVNKERERYQAQAVSKLGGMSVMFYFRYQAQAVSKLGGMSAIPKLNINDKMTLNQQDASYILSLECQTAIDNVLLQVRRK